MGRNSSRHFSAAPSAVVSRGCSAPHILSRLCVHLGLQAEEEARLAEAAKRREASDAAEAQARASTALAVVLQVLLAAAAPALLPPLLQLLRARTPILSFIADASCERGLFLARTRVAL